MFIIFCVCVHIHVHTHLGVSESMCEHTFDCILSKTVDRRDKLIEEASDDSTYIAFEF